MFYFLTSNFAAVVAPTLAKNTSLATSQPTRGRLEEILPGAAIKRELSTVLSLNDAIFARRGRQKGPYLVSHRLLQ